MCVDQDRLPQLQLSSSAAAFRHLVLQLAATRCLHQTCRTHTQPPAPEASMQHSQLAQTHLDSAALPCSTQLGEIFSLDCWITACLHAQTTLGVRSVSLGTVCADGARDRRKLTAHHTTPYRGTTDCSTVILASHACRVTYYHCLSRHDSTAQLCFLTQSCLLPLPLPVRLPHAPTPRPAAYYTPHRPTPTPYHHLPFAIHTPAGHKQPCLSLRVPTQQQQQHHHSSA